MSLPPSLLSLSSSLSASLKSGPRRFSAVTRLFALVDSELRESAHLTLFVDHFTKQILELIVSDAQGKLGGTAAMVALIQADVINTNDRVTRFGNYLRNHCLDGNFLNNINSNSVELAVLELSAKALAKLALVPSASHTANIRLDLIERESRRALELLASIDSNDSNRGSICCALLVLREIGLAMATFFFQRADNFFDVIVPALVHKDNLVRQLAVNALRVGLVVTVQREGAKRNEYGHHGWYLHCFDEAMKRLLLNQDPRAIKEEEMHGALLILSELLRCSHSAWEHKYKDIEMSVLNGQLDTTGEVDPWRSRFGGSRIARFFSSLRTSSSFASCVPEAWLTSVKVGDEPIVESSVCHDLLQNNFDKICTSVLQIGDKSKNIVVLKTLLSILPKLAAFDSQTFKMRGLKKALTFLQVHLSNERTRAEALLCAGLLAQSLGSAFAYSSVFASIHHSLTSTTAVKRSNNDNSINSAMLSCIALLSRSLGEQVLTDLKRLLNAMFNLGLSSSLITALHEIIEHVPALKGEVNERLMRVLTQVLLSKPLKEPQIDSVSNLRGNDNRLSTAAMFLRDVSSSAMELDESPDKARLVLALKTLAMFDFRPEWLMSFAEHCCEFYLASDHTEVRVQAIRTHCSLLRKLLLIPSEECAVSPTFASAAGNVMSSLLNVAVTDTEPFVRACVLDALDTSFDPLLARISNLSVLFMAVNDENFAIRERAMCLIGRVAPLNPAYTAPLLRQLLIQMLNEMEYSGVSRNQEQSAKLIGHLVSSSSVLISPYIEPILKVVIPRLSNISDGDLNSAVLTTMLATVGDLARVGGKELNPRLDKLLPLMLDILNDSSSSHKREVTLWTLGEILASTGCVIEPYHKFPQLLDLLLGFLRTEQREAIRQHTLRLLGILGAIDPFRHKMITGQIESASQTTAPLIPISDSRHELETSFERTPSELLISLNGGLDEFYSSVAISSLMQIISDPKLSQHSNEVVQAVIHIFRALGIKSVPFIPQVIPSMLKVIRQADSKFHDNLFRQLGTLVGIVQQHTRNYLDAIFELISDHWTLDSPLQPTIIGVIESIAFALGKEFNLFLPRFIPQMLLVLSSDSSSHRNVTRVLLRLLSSLGATLESHVHLLLPRVVALIDNEQVPTVVRKDAIDCVDQLCTCLNLSDYASLIMQPLSRCLESSTELRDPCMELLCSMVTELGKTYLLFVPMVDRVLRKHNIECQRYSFLVSSVVYHVRSSMPTDFDSALVSSRRAARRSPLTTTTTSAFLNDSLESAGRRATIAGSSISNLQQAWAVSSRVSREDWIDWHSRLCSELLRASPSPALRACWTVAQHHVQLSRTLFNAAFVSCWTELDANRQDELMKSLLSAMNAPDIPELSQSVLNLAEFMEHTDKGQLPVRTEVLATQAIKCRAFAKALYYKEQQFLVEPSLPVLESLIGINNKLGQKEAAMGLLEWGRKNMDANLTVHEQWYEKLHDWDRALALYREKAESDADDSDILLGQMRCLEALGEWEELHNLAATTFDTAANTTRMQMSKMAASAACGMQQWNHLKQYVQLIPQETQEGAFYRAVLAVTKEEWEEAQKLIDSARLLLDTEMSALVAESYQRAYPSMVTVQMLVELEEVIEMKMNKSKESLIRQMWRNRLKGCQRSVEDWQRILHVRSLVVSPKNEPRTWVKFASLCRKSGRMQLGEKTLVQILGKDPKDSRFEPIPTHQPHVTLAYCKHLWAAESRELAFSQLQLFVTKSLVPHVAALAHGNASREGLMDMKELLSRCFLKLGQWKESLQGLDEHSIDYVLRMYSQATEHSSQRYKAWHSYAVMNFEALNFFRAKQEQSRDEDEDVVTVENITPLVNKYAVPALNGFIKAIALKEGNSLQDTLRLLTLLFDYGDQNDIYEALHEGLRTIAIDTWLQVIPQLIARIDNPEPLVSRLVHQLLTDLGRAHPQALVYSLTVASKSSKERRRNAATKILSKIREHSAILVNQAALVSEELIRVAILWHEQWHEALEEASRLYFGDHNIAGMLDTLRPLHQQLARGPQTLKETAFYQAYGTELAKAYQLCLAYESNKSELELNQAWELYSKVFRRISRQLPKLTQLELQQVSPRLLACRNLELAVPGNYVPKTEVIRIASVEASLQVITSKQRPRKLSVRGSNGLTYMFLLKGHEDLRQDERVMQFFSLVNSLLLNDNETFRRNLAIQRLAVIPLSTNSGLIGWVPHSDTLHGLIKEFREKKNVLLNIEHRIMQRFASNSDSLPLMMKVEVFEQSLEKTQSDDLAQILRLKAPSSEVWFERRTNFTRSLAVMSMVGYLLGLGDRHPSNLLLDRMSGKILHIDFGDCFEVAMTREKFPEKIPFRLTRMLVKAMEVTGIEGTYRTTCESVMRVLRDNGDSLMAVLEAFVHDPLLNWRLVETTREQTQETVNKKALEIVQRVRDKLTGKDFDPQESLSVAEQVDRLILQATSHENLCQSYVGWCPFW